MALTKKTIVNKSFKGEFQHCEIETVTIVLEDGVEIGRSSHRETCMCGDDIKAVALGIKDTTDTVWTEKMKVAYTAYIVSLDIASLD